ncbi:MAG: ATP-binding protein [Verrucomicrobiota bacterium]|nr:ATP-binding protein [Verrucomicrobiota bacterium]
MMKRFFTPPSNSYFLFGPRGTGKSTWIREQYPDALWIDLLDLSQFLQFSASPSLLRDLVLGNPAKKIVVIDEVQKAPQLLSEVHRLIEEDKSLQFILTGSSARKLKREGVDLLAGRAILERMPPFYAGELGSLFSLERALYIGLLPLVIMSKEPEKTLKTYGGLYLKEEVQAEGLVRRLEDFARFLEIVSFSHASLINTSNIANECCLNRKTIESYLQILQDLLLSFHLTVFTKRAQRALSSHPKFYYFDAGVYRSLRPQSILDKPEEISGAVLEGLVAQHLKAWCDAQTQTHNLHFWRTRSGVEVDFIVYGPDLFLAIEVKHSDRIKPSDLKSLLAFKEDYPEATLLFLYRGKERLMKKEILCMPVEEFLLQINPYKRLFETAQKPPHRREEGGDF